MSKKNLKRQSIFQTLLLIGILIALNVLSSFVFKRLDLTKEGRFTLTQPTKDLLEDLDDIVYFKIYLDGEFPAGFKRLQNSSREMLDEFRAYSNNNIEFEFVNPNGLEDPEDRQGLAQQLMEKGLLPRRLVEQGDGYKEQIIFPGAIATYKGREMPVNLLLEQAANNPQEVVLNNSISLLEYSLANTIQKLQRPTKPVVAFLDGHGELPSEEVADAMLALQPFYILERINLKEQLYISPRVSALIVAKPTERFEEANKFKLDQYIMNGGKVLWLIDGVRASMDSLARSGGEFIAMDYPLNLEDQLFKYGARVNTDLVSDMQCHAIPMVVGQDKFGNAKQFTSFPWPYFPVITFGNQDHPITKSLDAITMQFASSIDTIRTKQPIKKTVLLTSSQYAKAQFSPAKIEADAVRAELNPARFNKSYLPVAVALEGVFESPFKNRLSSSTVAMIDTIEEVSVRDESKPTRMIVVSDGDVIRNEMDRRNNRPRPLGSYPFSKQIFANKDFIVNSVDYLTDDAGVMAARSKDVQLRLLDNEKITNEKTTWQAINLVAPLLILSLFGFAYNFWRRRKYRVR